MPGRSLPLAPLHNLKAMADPSILFKRQVTELPMLIVTNGEEGVESYLSTLEPPTFYANTAGALWAFPVYAGDGSSGANDGEGSQAAWLVSNEVYKRVLAYRF